MGRRLSGARDAYLPATPVESVHGASPDTPSNFGIGGDAGSVSVVPEPSTLASLVVGLVFGCWQVGRRRSQADDRDRSRSSWVWYQ
jgi:hypothetical protein